MSLGFHQAYCKPCQKSRACRIRRISCRRATTPSWRYCRTSSRSAFTSSGFTSSSLSLFSPRSIGALVALGLSSERSSFPGASTRLAGVDARATLVPALPSAGAIAPGAVLQFSAVGYGSIRPRLFPVVKTLCCVACRSGFAPGLNLVPGAFPQPRQRLRLRRFGKFHRRKSRRAQQRIHERAVLRSQARYIGFEQADVPPLKQPLEEALHITYSRGYSVL